MFQKILIANRGEIAVRIIRACREMGILSVAVYSEADRESLHTQLADEAVCIGKAPVADSYLNMERVLSAAIATKAQAIHPGFGFLSENEHFAAMCESCGIAFIGPSGDIIGKMGNKSQARLTMMEAGVPVVPGTKEPVYEWERGLELAKGEGKFCSDGNFPVYRGFRASHAYRPFLLYNFQFQCQHIPRNYLLFEPGIVDSSEISCFPLELRLA